MEGISEFVDRASHLIVHREDDSISSQPVVTRSLQQDTEEIRRRSEENIRKYRERQRSRANRNETRRESFSGVPNPNLKRTKKPMLKSASLPDMKFVYDTQAKWMSFMKRSKRGDLTTCPM